MTKLWCLYLLALGAAAQPFPALKITAGAGSACGGETLQIEANLPVEEWSLQPADGGSLSARNGANTTFTPSSTPEIVTVQARLGAQIASLRIPVSGPCLPAWGGEIVRAIAGVEQTGASGAAAGQNFLFDLFLSRPLPIARERAIADEQTRLWGPRARLWGEVKIDSFPQQVNSQFTALPSQFASAFGVLKLNQLAQSAAFTAGPEFRIGAISIPRGSYDGSSQRFALTLFAGAGATGSDQPAANATVFQIPAAGSAQRAALEKFLGGLLPAGVSNIAFIPPASNRFMQHYEAGLRLYTFYADGGRPLATPPATFEFSAGQDELVTGGRLSGAVGHVSATYPFSIGPRNSGRGVVVYLFGDAAMAYTRRGFDAVLPLAPAIDPRSQTPVAPSDPSVYIVTVPGNRRDTYRLGLGLDLTTVLSALAAKLNPPAH